MGRGALLVTVPKGGTHLVTSVLVKCGYLEHGVGWIRSPEERRALVMQLLTMEPYRSLRRDYWFIVPESLMWFVGKEATSRLLPVSAGVGKELVAVHDIPRLEAALKRLRNEQLFPSDVVLSVHELWHDDYRKRFLKDWLRSGQPRVIFNYRDPRDQLVSMVHFIRDSPLAGVLGEIYGPTLRSFDTLAEQLSYAIECPTFPYRNVYRTNAWMLHHPRVLKVRFEDLVGPAGGGAVERQRDAIATIAEFLGLTVDVDAVAAGLHGGTRTFRSGRSGTWQDVFSDEHRRAFEQRYGDLLTMYGYD